MPKGVYDHSNTQRPEEYELDNADYFFCRTEAILRAIYYCYKDMELDGKTDHEWVKDMVDSMIYNVLEAEKKIKAGSEHKPTPRPKIHGLEKKFTDIMTTNMNRYYNDLRSMAKERIHMK